jgi:Flp pilus assembly protein TadB
MRVTAPDGDAWDVHRRFRWPRFRTVDDDFDATSLFWGFGADDLAGLIFSIVVGLVLAVLIFILLPPLIFLVELVVVGFAIATTLRPWLVVAESRSRTVEWKVKGWRRSRRAIREIARQLRAGEPLTERW